MKSLLVGIAGPSCSGKTTIIKEIAKRVGEFEIIHADDYWNRDFEPPLISGFKNRELPDNVDLDLLFAHLELLKKGESVEVPYDTFTVVEDLDDFSNTRINKKLVKPKEIIIVEGFLLFYRKDIRDLFDLKVYIDLSDEEIVRRRLERNRSGKSREAYYRTVLVSEYRKYGLPGKKHADLVLDGNLSVERNAVEIIERIGKV